MKARRGLFSIVATVLLLFSPTISAAARTLTARIDRVPDGDTVIALTSNQTKLRIRLLGIDAPEVPHGRKPGQPFGEEAQDYLDHLIGGKTVRLETYGSDFHGNRVLAVVFDERVNVNCVCIST